MIGICNLGSPSYDIGPSIIQEAPELLYFQCGCTVTANVVNKYEF